MTLSSALLGFAVVAALITVTPGLDTALVLRAALRQSRSHALATATGVNAGVLVWGVAAAVGVSALLTASEVAFTTLRVAGAAYMAWLGLRLLAKAWPGDPAGPESDAEPSGGLGAAFRRGLLTNLLNPKVGAFYVAVIPNFLAAGVPHAVMGVLLALVHALLGVGWFTLVVLGAARMRRLLEGPAARRAVDAVTGTALLGFAVRLARSH